MPNWCDNRAILRHEDVKVIDALEAEMIKKNDDGLSMACPFQHLRPRPLAEEDWYNWNIQNWGSKWDANTIDWDRGGDNELTIYFDSAWSPPVALYEYLTEQGWEVDAVYHESGMGYAGMFVDGEDFYHEYDLSDLDSIEQLPEEIIEFGGLREEHEYWKEENESSN